MAALQLLTQQNAELLAAVQASQSNSLAAELVSELPDVAEVLNPDIDIAPDNRHWLQREIFPNPFKRKAK